jgi:hypothetical protein
MVWCSYMNGTRPTAVNRIFTSYGSQWLEARGCFSVLRPLWMRLSSDVAALYKLCAFDTPPIQYEHLHRYDWRVSRSQRKYCQISIIGPDVPDWYAATNGANTRVQLKSQFRASPIGNMPSSCPRTHKINVKGSHRPWSCFTAYLT